MLFHFSMEFFTLKYQHQIRYSLDRICKCYLFSDSAFSFSIHSHPTPFSVLSWPESVSVRALIALAITSQNSDERARGTLGTKQEVCQGQDGPT